MPSQHYEPKVKHPHIKPISSQHYKPKFNHPDTKPTLQTKGEPPRYQANNTNQRLTTLIPSQHYKPKLNYPDTKPF